MQLFQIFHLPNRLLCRSRQSLLKVSYMILGLIFFLLIFSFIVMFIMPMRNFLLSFVSWPFAWRSITTSQLIYMHAHAVTMDVGTCPTSCPRMYKHHRARHNVKYDGIKFYNDKRFESLELYSEKGRFLPLLSKGEKLDTLYTLEVAAHALKEAGLEFFISDGTLLGLVRNHAMIPWDDDVDISINGSNWKRISEVLCCVEGFRLIMKNNMQWRFYKEDGLIIPRAPEIRFPFLDMFLFTEDENYIWSMTKWNIQFFAFRKSDVFPLTSTKFEGIEYPIPRFPNKIIKQQFGDLTMCSSPSLLHKYNHALNDDEITRLPCSVLSDMYDFYDGLDGFS